MRPRVVLVVCAVVALAIGAYAVLAPSALPRLREMEAEQARLQGEVDAARAGNERLAREVKVLQGGEPESKAVLEKAAREELGWTKPDEIVLTVNPGLSSAPAPAPAPEGAQ
jgi:cell division protein FtsB